MFNTNIEVLFYTPFVKSTIKLVIKTNDDVKKHAKKNAYINTASIK